MGALSAGPGVVVLAASVLRQSVIPMLAFYLILMAALGVGLAAARRRGTGPARPAGQTGEPRGRPAAVHGAAGGWAALLGHVLGAAAGGYLLLLAVNVGYYYGVARAGGAFLASSVTGPALLIGLAMPIFAGASWACERARRRRGKAPGNARPPPP